MSSAVRKAACWTVRKCLLRPNVMQQNFGSARNAVSQARLAKVADRYDDTCQDYGQQSADTTPSEEAFKMYINNTGDTLSINLENVPNGLQKELIDELGLFLTSNSGLEQTPNVKINSLSEDVYRYKLYMRLRKLGYDCMFTRYNGDRGLASFKLEGGESKIRRSYYRSGLPNKC